jgi:hypothetical protein
VVVGVDDFTPQGCGDPAFIVRLDGSTGGPYCDPALALTIARSESADV